MSITDTLKERFKTLSEPLNPDPTGTEPSLAKLDGIKAIIFDFYGTLFISGVGDIGIDDGMSDAGLLLDALKGVGVQVSDDKAGTRGFEIYNNVVTEQVKDLKDSGIPYPEPDIRTVWKKVLKKMRTENLIQSATDANQHTLMAVEFEARMNPIWPMPDMEETLDSLKSREFELGIISNSQFYTPIAFEALADRTLQDLGFNTNLLHWSFDESRKKPGLIFYEHFLEKGKKELPDLKAENYLYVGNDMLKDVYPAHELGMKTALFAGDSRSLKWRKDDARTKNLSPDLVITELRQLLECV
jgi:putative hydrolase of the HAD superfamily